MRPSQDTSEGFTLSLALVDALPILFFGMATLMLGAKIGSGLFAVGAVVCFEAGIGKAITVCKVPGIRALNM